MWVVYLVVVVLIAGLVWVVWRGNAQRRQVEQDRAERRARTDELLARVLLGEDSKKGRPAAGERPSMARPMPPPIERMVKPAGNGQGIDVNLLLSDEPETVAARARRQLDQPTNLTGDGSGPATAAQTTLGPISPLSLREGQLDVPLDGLVVAWFEARGYELRRAPPEAQPITLLLSHREDAARSYAFFYDRGRLTVTRAAAMLDKARALGPSKLLVAAEHGADLGVGSGKLADVQVMDWPAIDRALKRVDARVAAKIIAIARTRRGTPSAD
jgi:hypothetical protein